MSLGASALALASLVVLPGVASAQSLPCIASHPEGVIASWCRRAPGYQQALLSISRDDGARWEQTGLEVEDATVRGDGTVIALVNEAGSHLVVFDGAAPRTVSLPFETGLAVRSVGTRLFVVGDRAGMGQRETLVVATDDLGAHLRDVAVLPRFVSLAGVETDDRGPRLDVWSVEGLSCFGTVADRLYRLEGDVLTTSVLRDDMTCAYTGRSCAGYDVIGLGAHGAVYGLARATDERTELVLLRAGRPAPLALRSESQVVIASNGRITLAVVDHQLVRLEGTRTHVLDHAVPAGADSLHVDAHGRAWLSATAGLFRFSRTGGFALVRAL